MSHVTVESILEMWKSDCIIDSASLEGTTMKNAILHQKYLDLLTHTKLRLRRKESELKILEKDKFLYYSGKMTREEMDDRGWAYDPFGPGIKPLKSDISFWYDADKDIQEAKMTIDYLKAMFDALAEILENVKWRHQHIKNIIDIRKFEAGT